MSTPDRSPRRRLRTLAAALAVAGLLGCDASPDGPYRVTSWGIAPLGDGPSTPVTPATADAPLRVTADLPFLLRVEIEAESMAADPVRFGLQARRNGGEWNDVLARDFPYPDGISTPRVSIVAAPGGAGPTGDALSGSDRPFVAGERVSLDSVTAPWSGSEAHGEWEWPLVIRRWADGAVTNDDGDRFEFRLVDADRASPVAAAATIEVELEVVPGWIGGTYAETPDRFGPFRSDAGAIYWPMEPAETFNVLMMVRSDDGGDTWLEVDAAGRPATGDLEGVAAARVGDVIHILHQPEHVVHHAFRMEGASGPDAWIVRDEPVSTPSEPPTQIASLVARSNGSLVALYGDSAGIRMRVRSPAGEWDDERSLDRPDGLGLSGVHAAVDPQDRVHVVHTAKDPRLLEIRVEADPVSAAEARATTTASVWYRRVLPDGTVTPPVRIADGLPTEDTDAGAAAPVAVFPDGSAVVVWRAADGTLRSRPVSPRGTPGAEVRVSARRVVQNPSDSDQVGADLVVHDGRIHLAFADEETGDLWWTTRGRDGVWSEAEPLVEGITVQWVRGEVFDDPRRGAVWAIVYDAGSDGGSGMNRWLEVPLEG